MLGREERLDNHIRKVLQDRRNMDKVLVADDHAPDASVYMIRPMVYDAHGGVIVDATEAYEQGQL